MKIYKNKTAQKHLSLIHISVKNGLALTDSLYSEDRTADPFITYQKAVRGKKVTVVGHFPYLNDLFEPVCDLSIIEAMPEIGDFPEQSAEYLIPGSDFVFLGPLTLIDKSLPRLLELAEGAFIGMVGPASTLAVSYTHLDVYKRQCQSCSDLSDNILCFPRLCSGGRTFWTVRGRKYLRQTYKSDTGRVGKQSCGVGRRVRRFGGFLRRCCCHIYDSGSGEGGRSYRITEHDLWGQL